MDFGTVLTALNNVVAELIYHRAEYVGGPPFYRLVGESVVLGASFTPPEAQQKQNGA